jgi:hypothetical protein
MIVDTVSEVQTTQKGSERERRIFTSQVVWLLLSIFEALLAVRFVLKLIGAKSTTPLAGVIYVFSGLMRLRIFQF